MNTSCKISLPIPNDSTGIYVANRRMSLNGSGELVYCSDGERPLGVLEEDTDPTRTPGGRPVATIFRVNGGGLHYGACNTSLAAGDEFVGDLLGRIKKAPEITITAIDDTSNAATATAHGLVIGDQVVFSSLTGGTGLTEGVAYWVLTVADADTFTVSATRGGSVVDVTVDYTAAVAKKHGVAEGVAVDAGAQYDIIRVAYY